MVKWLRQHLIKWPGIKTLFVKVPLMLLGGLVFLLLLVVLIFSLPAGRGIVLNKGLAFAGKTLPGTLSWSDAHWRKFGTVELENLQWIAPVNQGLGVLAEVNRLAFTIDLESLRQKDVRVQSIELLVGFADVPSIMMALDLPAIADSTQSAASGSSTSPVFPRSGCVPGVPSVALQSGRFSAEKIVLRDGMVISNFTMDMGIEAGYGRTALVNVDHLAASVTVTLPDTSGLSFTGELSHAALNVRPVNGTYEGGLDCNFVLPGGEQFHRMIPASVPPELVELVQESVQGSLTLQGKLQDEILKGQLVLDLGGTPWLDRALVNLSFNSPMDFQPQNIAANLETLDVALLGTSVLAHGEISEQSLQWKLALDVADASLPLLFAGKELQNTDLTFQLTGQGDGNLTSHQVAIDFGGTIDSPLANVPQFSGQIEGGRAALAANLIVDGPIVAGGVVGDSLHVALDGNLANPDSLVTNFSLSAWAPQLYMSIGGQARRGTVQEVQLDSLVIVAAGLRMSTPHSSLFRFGPVAGNFLIKDFSLVGDPGSVSANGHLSSTGFDFNSSINVFMPEEMLQSFVPHSFWSLDGGADASFIGEVGLKGTTQSPTIEGSFLAKLLPHRDDPVLGLGLDFFLDDSHENQAGLGVDFSVSSGDSVLLKGCGRWPGTMDLSQGSWVPAAGDSIKVQVPEQLFNLELLNRMMPMDVELTGPLSLVAGASISPPGVNKLGGVISGQVQLEKTQINLPNRSRISVGLGLALQGTIADPAVVGEIDISSGFFRIPELPKSLHPAEGTSLLWEAIKSDTLSHANSDLDLWLQTAIADSLQHIKSPAMVPDLDIAIHIPGNLRVHGYGLDVELGGDLKVKRGEDAKGIPMPVIDGSVEILEGTLRFMNRIFTSQKGDVHFSGHAPANPTLDIKMEAEVGSYLIKIAVSGSATDPVIELSSEPEMNEVDIMAVLFFGQPANDLDNDQRGHMNDETDPGQQLKENLAGLAMVFGTAGLSNSMSNTLGVDMLEVGSDSSGDSTIMVGKFLTPKVMLKYHHSLEKSGSYFMTLEYSLSKFFKLISSYGQGDEPSGLELGFTKRY